MNAQILEYSLDMRDTPGFRRFVIEGETAVPVGVAMRDGELFLQVEHSGGYIFLSGVCDRMKACREKNILTATKFLGARQLNLIKVFGRI